MKTSSKEPQAAALEWRVSMPGGASRALEPAPAAAGERRRCSSRMCICSRLGLGMGIGGFLERAWKMARNEPKKVMHCVKVGLALSLVSLFYYMRPLYDGVGGTAMWAVMTVVVVFEYTVGATLCKSVNRATGTFLAGALGMGVHWVASHAGDNLQPVILQASVFILATAATFSRFIPSVKARFDYGAMIFILTFSLVSVSGYRVDKLFEMAHHRLSTIAIGTSLCVITTMVVSPVWAGTELHNIINTNMDRLSDSLNACVAEYFKDGDDDDAKASDGGKNEAAATTKALHGYKCALNSKTTEESMANFARWEPAHGSFNFGHPWKEYLKVGASLRSCAYCIEALNASIASDAKAPDFLKKHFSKFCVRLSGSSSALLKELAISIAAMKKSSRTDLMVEEMRNAVRELQNALKSLSTQWMASTGEMASDTGEEKASPRVVTLTKIVPLVTVASLLIEIAARTETVAQTVTGLADKAEFKVESAEETKKFQSQKV
ncbi:aluminum-activated malate transporter 10 [Andrographis paniculata]|uniref:aluminum-activated malate transporter 10 n=1 Tax=Andrographis paniculata TaxID=175694 RepID=UPI0021E8252D|nr:aluminum-activated malate transporter 10 [Andrographis paniculata]